MRAEVDHGQIVQERTGTQRSDPTGSSLGFVGAVILIVHDRAADLTALEAALTPANKIFRAGSGADALQAAAKEEIAVAVIDVRMPDMDGFELVERLRKDESTRRLPEALNRFETLADNMSQDGVDGGAERRAILVQQTLV